MTELTWRRKLAFSAVAAGVFFVILAVIGEVAVRFITPKSEGKLGERLEGSARIYGLRPNQRTVHVGVPVEINAVGFRENDYPVERRPGVKRIVVLGDSYTFGVGVDFEETFHKRLERSLKNTEVLNFGVPGYNTTNELATLREVAARYKPDLVIVGYVLNDAEVTPPEGAVTEKKTEARLLDRIHLGLKDTSMLYRFVAPRVGEVAKLFGARYAVGQTGRIIRSFEDDAPGWRESRESLLAIAEEARRLGAPTLVVIFPMMVDFRNYPLAPAHARIREFCEAHKIPVIDMLPAFKDRNAAEYIVVMDGHPNGRAHEIFATRILEYLRNGARHEL